jgi:hypothetical protein
MTQPTIPPVEWRLRRRVRYFGGLGLLCGIVVAAITLLFADIPGGRSFNKYGSPAWNPLWPELAALLTVPPLAGTAAAILLPLYRRRHGGVWVGLGTLAGTVGILMLAGATWRLLAGRALQIGIPSHWGALEWTQSGVAVGGLVIVAVSVAVSMRGEALGEASAEHRAEDAAPPVT